MSIEHLPLEFCLHLMLFLEDSQKRKSVSTLLDGSFILFRVTSRASSSELHYIVSLEKMVLSREEKKVRWYWQVFLSIAVPSRIVFACSLRSLMLDDLEPPEISSDLIFSFFPSILDAFPSCFSH